MKLSSNSAFNLLGVVCMVVLIGALMLAGWAGLSTTGIIVTGIVVAAIGNFVAIILLAKYNSEREEPADGGRGSPSLSRRRPDRKDSLPPGAGVLRHMEEEISELLA